MDEELDALPEDESAAEPAEVKAEFIPCPDCGEAVYPIDAFCRECGQPFCPQCFQAVDDDDETCPHCHVTLFFDCPECQFELTAGTDMCPNCNSLFRVYCGQCQTMVLLTQAECPTCQTEIAIEKRESARIVQSLNAGLDVVKIVACPECGQSFDPGKGSCPGCGLKICNSCQMVLFDDEPFCPRCDDPKPTHWQCPKCEKDVELASIVCPHCDQELCPECGAAVSDEDTHCQSCGVEFTFACPQCDADIPASTDVCPNCHFQFDS